MEHDIVLIEWVDSQGMQRWEYLDEIEPFAFLRNSLLNTKESGSRK
jgi:hypothetical protein